MLIDNRVYFFFMMEYALFCEVKVVEKKLELKNQSSVICYIEMLQNNISRMSSQSGIIKASMCVVYTILITIILAIDKLKEYWWIIIVLTILGMLLDAYYLGMEKIYVTKYNNFVKELNNGKVSEDEIYDMKPRNTQLKSELLAEMLLALKSFSIIGFYLIFIIIGLIIKFV